MAFRRAVLALLLALPAPFFGFGCSSHNLAKLDMSDPGIRARVLAELKSHPEFNLRYLEVNVNVRAVYLSGMVESDELKRDIQRAVSAIAGVRYVVNNLLVLE
jgi:osmotically-inducible protein OsmY